MECQKKHGFCLLFDIHGHRGEFIHLGYAIGYNDGDLDYESLRTSNAAINNRYMACQPCKPTTTPVVYNHSTGEFVSGYESKIPTSSISEIIPFVKKKGKQFADVVRGPASLGSLLTPSTKHALRQARADLPRKVVNLIVAYCTAWRSYKVVPSGATPADDEYSDEWYLAGGATVCLSGCGHNYMGSKPLGAIAIQVELPRSLRQQASAKRK